MYRSDSGYTKINNFILYREMCKPFETSSISVKAITIILNKRRRKASLKNATISEILTDCEHEECTEPRSPTAGRHVPGSHADEEGLEEEMTGKGIQQVQMGWRSQGYTTF